MPARIGRLVIVVLAWLTTTLTIVAAVIAWRLAAGPVAVDAWNRYVEAALRPVDGSYEVRIGASALAWEGFRHPLEVVAEDVRIEAQDGTPLVVLPRLRFGLSARALLLDRMLAPTEVALVGPSAELVRGADGALTLRLPGAGIERPYLPPEGAPSVLGALVGQLLAPPDGRTPLGHLERVSIRGGRLLVSDAQKGLALEIPWLDAELERRPYGLQLRAQMSLDQADGTGWLGLTARFHGAVEEAVLELDLQNLWPATFTPWLGEPLPVQAELPLSGRLRLRLGGEGLEGPVGFTLEGERGRVVADGLLARPLRLDRVRAAGRLDPGAESLDLADLDLVAGEMRVRASGRWRRAGQAFAVAADARAENIDLADLDLYWPSGLSPKARAWVINNIPTGRVSEAEVRARLDPEDIVAGKVPAGAIDGRFRYQDVEVHFFRPLPPLVEGAGEGRFTAESLEFLVESGRTESLVVEQGRAAIADLGDDEARRLRVEALAKGPLADALAFIDREPLGLIAPSGIDVAAVSGNARARLTFELPLRREPRAAELVVAMEGTASEVALPALLDGVDLSEGALEVTVADSRLAIAGTGRFNEVPLAVRFEQALEGERTRRYAVEGEVAAEALSRFGLEAGERLTGALGVAIEGEDAPERPLALEIAVDLERAALDLGALGWHKPAGAPGRLEARISGIDNGRAELERFLLVGADLEARGRGTLQTRPAALERLDIDHLRHGASILAARLAATAGELRLDLAGERLDLRPLLAAIREVGVAAWLERIPTDGPVRARFALDALRLSDLEDLEAVRGELAAGGPGRLAAAVRGRLAGGGGFTVDLRPDDGPLRLRLISDDAGALLRALEQGTRVEGGWLDLDAALAVGADGAMAQGELRLGDVTVTRAPILARLLTLASLTGIRQALEGRGIWFDHVRAPFAVHDGRLAIEDARAIGSQIGLTVDGAMALDTGELDLSGTIVPVYALNRAIGNIPLIGRLLRGREGEGAFAASYALRGTAEEPEITINPLSVITPGFVQDLFREAPIEPAGPPAELDR